MDETSFWGKIGILGLFGLLAGLGTLLASKEVLTMRIVIGRALASFTLGVASASILAFVPGLSFEAQVGLACLLSSLGTSGLERMYQLWRGK